MLKSQSGFAQLLLILILLAGIGIAVYLTQFTQVFKPKAAGIQQLSLAFSRVSRAENRFTTWIYKAGVPAASYNFVGLKGSVAVQDNTPWGSRPSEDIVLFSVLNYPSGQACPETGELVDPNNLPPLTNFISSFVVKLNSPGVDQVATDFNLPVKVPMTGCIALMVSGGDPNAAHAVSMNSNISFVYDTEPAVSPAPYIINLGNEFCIGRPHGTGCFASFDQAQQNEPFIAFQKIKQRVKLLSLTGNQAVGGLRYYPGGTAGSYYIPYPSISQWSTTANYSIYPQCNMDPAGAGVPGVSFPDWSPVAGPMKTYGPAVALSSVPGNAVSLFTRTLTGGRDALHAVGDNQGGQLPILQFFNSPPIIEAGDCIVHMQKFSSDGALSVESQVYAVVQPYTPAVPVNAVWSAWSPAVCPVACGTGTQTRTCTEQQNGGIPCSQTDGGNASRSCNTQACPVKKTGDLDNDGDVDLLDFNTFVADFRDKNLRSDFNKNGRLDIFDFNLLVQNFGK